jgi:kinesin family protein 11
MATRRAAPSRPRINTQPPPPPPQQSVRARSVMSKSSSSARDDNPEFNQLPVQKQHATAQDDCETNIQVVIRCRRRSEREIQDNSPIIVSSNGPRSQDVTIETSTPFSSLGVVTLPPTRTYPFDLVFGPEADQAMIYHDVVSPMLDQVLTGYNCTLFAYGQTGTGKTYVHVPSTFIPISPDVQIYNAG